MFNLQPYEGKTVQRINQHAGQVIIYFTDESFLIITAQTTSYGILGPKPILEFSGRALDNPEK